MQADKLEPASGTSMQSIGQDIRNLWRVYRTVHRMAYDRGYQVAKAEWELPLEEFVQRFSVSPSSPSISRDSLQFVFNKSSGDAALVDSTKKQQTTGDSSSLLVFFSEEYTVGVKTIRGFVEAMSMKQCPHALIILRQSITPAASKILSQLSAQASVSGGQNASPAQQQLRLETFHEQELLVNLTQHQLVPEHRVLSRTEVSELLSRYRLSGKNGGARQLPRIQLQDPVCRYFGLVRGDVVKIIRPSETAGRYVTYRLVM